MAMPMAMDLNDVEYDAFLANDRTLDDPLVVRVERSGRVRLRIINGAASSAFWIELGELKGTLVAVDGNPVVPVAGSRFPIAIAQRLDLIVDVAAGAFPCWRRWRARAAHRVHPRLARSGDREGGRLAATAAAAVDLSLEAKLRASSPLPDRAADVVLTLALTGSMAPYRWGINGRLWPNLERGSSARASGSS